MPNPPDGLKATSIEAWRTWMASWVAANWTPGDLPGLRIVIALYDQVERGQFVRSGELRLWLDSFGISPRGAQALRWARPIVDAPKAPTSTEPYRHLRAVRDGESA